jgi:hypothetical protein
LESVKRGLRTQTSTAELPETAVKELAVGIVAIGHQLVTLGDRVAVKLLPVESTPFHTGATPILWGDMAQHEGDAEGVMV